MKTSEKLTTHGKFGTAINCIDGRVQMPVMNWMKGQFHLDYVDMITEPGPDKVLFSGQPQEIESIRAKALISAKAHGSRVIVISGHHDCAGNPVEREQHYAQLRGAIQTVASWNLPQEQILAVWINEDANVEVVASR